MKQSKFKARIWMVRSGGGSFLLEEFIIDKIVAIGWNDLGDLSAINEYQELKALFKHSYPDDSDGRVNQSCGQLWRFLHEFDIGDKVITYDSNSRQYYLGEIISPYVYDKNATYFHTRKIEWIEAPTDRDVLDTESKNTLGATLTIFEISHFIWDQLLNNNPSYISEEDLEEIEQFQIQTEAQNLESLKADTVARSTEFIKDIIAHLSWQNVELLVAGVLRAMGYKTRMTNSGGDLGSDIIAAPDELALTEPRIKVEVKTRSKDKMQAPDIRNFIGGLRDYNKGIFVSTSGFTKEAKYESERANIPITLIDLDWLVELLVTNYEQLDVETKALVPLKRIYWPI